MKNLFLPGDLKSGPHRYTTAALELNEETVRAIQSIFKSYVSMGYSPREISHIMLHAVMDIETEEVL
jgi:hypothetical protein